MFYFRIFTFLTVSLTLLLASQWICGANGSSSTSWLSQCTAEGLGELKQLYVSTIDGKITALSSTGRRQWRYKFSQPLYSSSLSYSEPSSQFPNLIPGLDKKVYRWDGIQLSPLAVSLDDMLSEQNQPDVIRVGGKMKEDVALDVATGKPLYHCTHISCHKYDNQSFIGRMDRLLISAHRTTVREASSLTGEEIWNFTVSRLQLALVEGQVSSDEDISCLLNGEGASDWVINVDASQGILYVSNSYTKLSWNYVFPAPIMDVWLHHGGKLEKVSLSPLRYPTETSPTLLLGVWHNQYYIQPTVDGYTPSVFKPWGTRLIGGPDRYGNDVDTFCDLTSYIPILPSDRHGNKAIALYNNPENWLNDLSTLGPNGLALYFHPLNDDHASCYNRELENSSDDQTTPTKSTIIELEDPGYISKALEYGRSILNYSIFAVIVLAVNKIRRYHSQKKQRNRLSSSSSDTEEEVFKLSDDLGAGEDIPSAFINTRRSSSSSTIKPSQTYDLLPILEEENSQPGVDGGEVSSSFPQTPLHIGTQSTSDIEPKSHFETEYTLLGVLGKGGFGVVYHVKKNTDNIEYALKRIKLPEKSSAREKVMREVHALAQLDHPHIVRYFNSWKEKAPPRWDQREEWGVPLSRVNSLVKMDGLTSSSKPSYPSQEYAHSLSNQPITTTGASSESDSSECHPLSNGKHAHSGGSHTHSNGSLHLSAIASFSSELPPLRSTLTTSDSQSSFTIDFRDDSQSRLSGDEFSRPGSPISISSIGSSSHQKNKPSSIPSVDIASNYDNGRISSFTSNGETSEVADTDQLSQDIRPHPQSATPSFVFIQMQLCQKESLRDWLKKNVENRLRVEVLDMFEQILNAVVYVHNKGLMHRDLKPSNIFFSLDGRIKVGDFGLVTGHVTPDAHNNSFNVLKHLGNQLESDSTGRHTGNIGTHFYVSPEQMLGLKYDQKVDIFSLGVILFELNHPFVTEMERAKVLECLRKSKFPVNFKKHLQHEASFVEWLMSPVCKRPTALEVCNSTRLEELKRTINSDTNKSSVVPKL